MPSVPTLSEQGGTYELEWFDENLAIRVDRVHTDKAGVYGEILIKTTAPNMAPHIHGPVHFNLIATTTRAQLVRHLQTIIPLDWSGVLEQACYKVVELHRTGAPAIQMANHEQPDTLGMRVHPILQEKQSTLFFGDGDSLKSFFSTFLSTIICTGQKAAGLTPEPGSVLYLDYETDVDTFWERVNLLTTGLDVAFPDTLHYLPMYDKFADEFARVNASVMKLGIDLVVVDSAAPATLEPETADAVTTFYKSLRALQCTSLVIAHQTKTSSGDYPFGSTFWRNLPRSNFHIKADRGQTDPVVGLRHTKSNNGRRLPTLGFAFDFSDDSLQIQAASPADYPDLSQGMPVLDRVTRLVRHGSQSMQTLLRQLNDNEAGRPTSEGTLKNALTRAGKDGRLINIDGQWGLPYQGDS